MNRMDRTRSVLVLVDYQQRLMPTIDDGEAVVEEAVFLAEAAHIVGVRVLGTEQNPAGLGPNVARVRDRCEAIIAKDHFDACRDGLREALGTPPRDLDVVIAGCEAHVCLLQTALGLLRAGHAVFVVAPACGSRTTLDHELAMRRLRQAGAAIVSPEMVAFEWLATCRDPQFRSMLSLLKERAARDGAAGDR